MGLFPTEIKSDGERIGSMIHPATDSSLRESSGAISAGHLKFDCGATPKPKGEDLVLKDKILSRYRREFS